MFRHRWNYFLRLLYSDGTHIPTVWTELATASKSERRVVIEESVLALAQEWRVEPPLISPVLLEKLRGYGGILITPNRGKMAYLLF